MTVWGERASDTDQISLAPTLRQGACTNGVPAFVSLFRLFKQYGTPELFSPWVGINRWLPPSPLMRQS